MKKISLTTRKLMTIVLSLILVATTILVSSNELSTVSALNGTPNQEVTTLLSNVKVNITSVDDGTKCVTDNVAVKPMYNGSYYAVKINWEILTEDYEGHVEAGDYFWLDISNNYFAFSNSSTENDLVYEGVTIGKWKVQDNKIRCEFTEACENFLHVSGYFEAEGSLSSTNRGTYTVTLGGVPIEIQVNPETSGFPYSELPELSSGGNPLDKYGTHYRGTDVVYWYILVNYAYATEHYLGNDAGIQTVQNAVVKDVLPDDLILEDIMITTPVNHPKNATTLTSESACKIDLTSQFTVKNESDFASATEWEEYINANPLTYGISTDKKTVIINLGNLPGSLYMSDTKDNFKTMLAGLNLNLTTEEINALTDIYYDDTTSTYPVYAANISLETKSDSTQGILQKESYSNNATLSTTNFDAQNAATTLAIEKMDAGIEASTPKSAILTKKDFDTNAVIPGASFKLQKLNGTEWVDYTPATGNAVRVTDNNGQVTFDDLGTGTYRFVETVAADGYDITSVAYSATQFVVSSTDTNGHEITATNRVNPISISGTKTWNDNGNAANKRPDSITVRLMNGDTEVDAKTVTATDNWEYTFENLPKYDDEHNLITYTIKEDTVAGYNTTIDGYNITNTYIPPETTTAEETTTEEESTTPEETTIEEETTTPEETTTEEETTSPEETTTEEEITTPEETTTEKSTKDEYEGEQNPTEVTTDSDRVQPVKAGDNNQALEWLLLSGLSVCAVSITLIYGKRKEHIDEQ